MVIKSAEFIKSAVSLETLPDDERKEVMLVNLPL